MKNKKNIVEGLNQNSAFNKMKEAFGASKLSNQEEDERKKWIAESERFQKEEKVEEILSQFDGEVKPQLKPLTPEEMMMLPILIKYLQRKTNDVYHITADQIIRDFNNNKERLNMKNNLNIPRLMKLTAYIRYNKLARLVSGASGYFISNDPYVILSCYYSLQSRANAIMAAAEGMKSMATDMIVLNNNQNSDPFGFDFE